MYHVRFALFQTVSAAAVAADDLGFAVLDTGEVADTGASVVEDSGASVAEDFGFAFEGSSAAALELDSRAISFELLELSLPQDANSTPVKKADEKSTIENNAVVEHRASMGWCRIAESRAKAEKCVPMDISQNL